MESVPDPTQIPLLDPPPQKQVPAYFDTNILDNCLFFWVNKFIAVFLLLMNNCPSKILHRRQRKRPFLRMIIGISDTKKAQKV